jgi:hypothetical protein
MRDQLQRRAILVVSLIMQGISYFAVPGGPLDDPAVEAS